MISRRTPQLILFGFGLIALLLPIFALFNRTIYYPNVHAIGSLLTSYFVGALGVTIASKRLDKEERVYFFLLTLSVFFWLWTAGLAYLCRPNQDVIAMRWFKVGNFGVVFIAAHIYAFTVKFLKLNRRRTLTSGYIFAGIFALLTISTNYFVSGVRLYPWGFSPQWSLIKTIPYFIYFCVYMTLSLAEYFRSYSRPELQKAKNQSNYLILAFSISYLGAIDYLPVFGFQIYPLGFVAVLGWWTVLAYAILKHRLMDITIIIRKTLIYSLVTGFLTFVYLGTVTLFAHIFEGLTGYQTVFSSAFAALLITSCFQPLRKKVQSFVDSKFFRQYVDREEKLYELSREVITHTTKDEMANALMRVITEALHPKVGALYLRAPDKNGFIRAADPASELLPVRMDEDNPLAVYFHNHPQPFIQDLISEEGHSESTRLKEEREDVA
jgi:hypothetical protein